ncbi:hypothetical protein PHYBOEH_008587 [Phytophthora boehmeriae]|uniref:Uncharacterized protein n=1 Tax=Phytophthora boehmeriae TaxID=109152 RepID=A0A8T1W412_9STRA|nr:hypothetical protein PHYBOEH_008587 [Phytophthora boehmeriae]
MPAQGKSQRKRLQRQLEFYLSESNLRQDKFLQQAMDAEGFVPVRTFLSFNKLKMLKATERMILDAAEKSAAIRVDLPRACIAPQVLLAPTGQDASTDARTIYIDSFNTTDDHDTLRRTFAKFGKVNLVSMPRFAQSKKFKGFGFVEFSEQSAAEEAEKASTSFDLDLRGIRVMNKTRWAKMKEQLKVSLSSSAAPPIDSRNADNGEKDSMGTPSDKKNTSVTTDKKKKRRRTPQAGHIHFDEDENDNVDKDPETRALLSGESDEQNVVDDGTEPTKKQKV